MPGSQPMCSLSVHDADLRTLRDVPAISTSAVALLVEKNWTGDSITDPVDIDQKMCGPRKNRFSGKRDRRRAGFSTRRRNVSNAVFTSSRASGPPKQVWMPLPQPRCSLSLRSGSNLFGSGN